MLSLLICFSCSSDASVFENMVNTVILSKLGCMMSVNIWKETIVYDELTIKERQKTDMECLG